MALLLRIVGGGYFPQCDNRWNVKLCPKQRGEKIFCDEQELAAEQLLRYSDEY